MIITFCGHSNFCKSVIYMPIVLEMLEQMSKDEQIDFYLGGYGRFDEFAYECAATFKQKHANTGIFLITPYLDRKRFFQNEKYDAVIYPELEKVPLRFAISYRNKWMADKADLIIAYVNRSWGGAYQMYKYAESHKKTILNLGEEITVE